MSAKYVLNFILIMSNKKVTAYHIAIPLDFKVAINSFIADMSLDRCGQLYLQPEN